MTDTETTPDWESHPVMAVWPDAEISGDPPFFRLDVFPEGTADENWDLYCSVQEAIRAVGWKIVDPYIEHDCISGPLVQIESAL